MNSINRKLSGRLKSSWDERQLQAYRRINSSLYNLTWVLLLAAVLLQVLLYPREPSRWLAELILFLVVSLVAAARYLKAGLWTQFSQTYTNRQGILGGVAAALLITAFSVIRILSSAPVKQIRVLGIHLPPALFLLLQALLVFAVGYGLIALLGGYHHRKRQRADKLLDEEEQV